MLQLRGSNLKNQIEFFDANMGDQNKTCSILFNLLEIEVFDMSKGWKGLATEDIWSVVLECDQNPRETNRPMLEVKVKEP